MGSEEIPISQLKLPTFELDEATAEDELKYRTEFLKVENNHLQTLYEDEKKNLIELMKCDDYKKQQNFFNTEFTKLNDYLEIVNQELIVIKDQYNSHGEKLTLATGKNAEVSRLLKAIEEQETKNKKFRSENETKVETLNEIRRQTKWVETEIFEFKNSLIEKRCKKSEYDVLQAELKEEKEKKLEREKVVKTLTEELKSLRESRVKKNENFENEEKGIILKSEIFKLKIEEKKKQAKQLAEFKEILKTLEEKEKSELDDRQKIQAEQTAELAKLEEQLKISEQKFENAEKNFEERCKVKNWNFTSFLGSEESKIQEILENLEKNIRENKAELEESEQILENSLKTQEQDFQWKRKKFEETENLLKVKREKHNEDKRVLEELRQKIIEGRKKIASQMQEKQENSLLSENAISRKKELTAKIEELRGEVYQEQEKIALVENMKKDVLEVNQHVEEALGIRKSLIAEEAEFKGQTKDKLKLLEDRIVEETRNFNDKILALETEIQQNAKHVAQMKREVKKRDNKEMKIERNLREKISKLQEERRKLKTFIADKKSELKSEKMEIDIIDENKVENRKSILKSPSTKKVMENPLETKSPRKVQFDVESDESSLSQFPLTQKPRSP